MVRQFCSVKNIKVNTNNLQDFIQEVFHCASRFYLFNLIGTESRPAESQRYTQINFHGQKLPKKSMYNAAILLFSFVKIDFFSMIKYFMPEKNEEEKMTFSR